MEYNTTSHLSVSFSLLLTVATYSIGAYVTVAPINSCAFTHISLFPSLSVFHVCEYAFSKAMTLPFSSVLTPTTKSMADLNVAALFLHHVVTAHILPETLVGDRDPVFTSHFWRRLLELLGIRANRSSAIHPRRMAKRSG